MEPGRNQGGTREGTREPATTTWCSTYPGGTGLVLFAASAPVAFALRDIRTTVPPSVRGTDSRNWRTASGAWGEEKRPWAMDDGHKRSKKGSAGHMKPPPSSSRYTSTMDRRCHALTCGDEGCARRSDKFSPPCTHAAEPPQLLRAAIDGAA